MDFFRKLFTTYRRATTWLLIVSCVGGLIWWFITPKPGPIDLHEVHKADNARLDVIFVHGLEGHWKDTWQDPAVADFWPEEIGKSRGVNVYSIGYDASSTEWVSGAMSIQDRGRNILELLVAHKIGDRPIVFVTHSLGGLVTNSALRSASDGTNDQWRRILNQTRRVVYFATPHSGSNLANYIQNAEAFGLKFRSGTLVDQLRNNSHELRDLNYWYRDNSTRYAIETVAYVESGSVGPVLVVDATQGNPGISGVTPIMLDADHKSICKLKKTDVAYLRVGQFIDDTIALVGEGPNGPWKKIDVTQPNPSLSCIAQVLITDDTLRGPIDAPMKQKIAEERRKQGYTKLVADRIAYLSPVFFPGARSIQFPASSEAQYVLWILARNKQGCQVLQQSIDLSNGSPVKLDWESLSTPVQFVVFAFPYSEASHNSLNHPNLKVQPNVSF